ncbi:hypothetical protein ACFSWE_04050 [Leucobacter albus]|uniref:Uncharacterized protein n=1 Tax=Leucobacter albus TaxID=272210 RepID=A0ABW3TNZ9_9MICO
MSCIHQRTRLKADADDEYLFFIEAVSECVRVEIEESPVELALQIAHWVKFGGMRRALDARGWFVNDMNMRNLLLIFSRSLFQKYPALMLPCSCEQL